MEFLNSILKQFKRSTPPGSAPGTIAINPDEPPPIIHLIEFSDGELIDKQIEDIQELNKHKATPEVTWVNINGLGDAEVIREIGEIFGLHHLALEDVVNVHQRAKMEEYQDHLFLVARMADFDKRLKSKQISFFISKTFLLTFQEHKPDDCLDPVRVRIREAIGRIRYQAVDYLLYTLLDSIIDHYFPVVDSYGEKLDDLDYDLIHDRGNTTIAALHNYQSDILMLRRSIRPHRELVNSLIRNESKLISDETRIFLRDCYDHTIQISDAIDAYRETCSSLREFHLASVSNRTNEVMKTLTIVSTIFIPLSFISGVYGMNFQNMPELEWKYGYFTILGIMATIVTGFLCWFRYKDWFR